MWGSNKYLRANRIEDFEELYAPIKILRPLSKYN
jgi:hypothetical protein